MRKSF